MSHDDKGVSFLLESFQKVCLFSFNPWTEKKGGKKVKCFVCLDLLPHMVFIEIETEHPCMEIKINPPGKLDHAGNKRKKNCIFTKHSQNPESPRRRNRFTPAEPDIYGQWLCSLTCLAVGSCWTFVIYRHNTQRVQGWALTREPVKLTNPISTDIFLGLESHTCFSEADVHCCY